MYLIIKCPWPFYYQVQIIDTGMCKNNVRKPGKIMNNRLIEKIIEDYFNTDRCCKIDLIKGGLTNYNYRVTMTSGRQYFLKIFRNADFARVQGIAELIRMIGKWRFPTPELIRCNTGQYYWLGENQAAILTDYIEGSYPEKNTANLYKIGVLLGVLHQVPVEGKLLHGYSLNYEKQLADIQRSKQSLPPDLENFLGVIDPVIRGIPPGGFSESIIHGDIFTDNLLLTDLDDIFFIDFEGGCVDKSIFDLSRAVIGCAIDRDEIRPELTLALLKGYDESRKLSPLERAYLFENILYAGTVSTLWRFIEFQIKRPEENKPGLYRKLMNPTLRFAQLGKDRFMESTCLT